VEGKLSMPGASWGGFKEGEDKAVLNQEGENAIENQGGGGPFGPRSIERGEVSFPKARGPKENVEQMWEGTEEKAFIKGKKKKLRRSSGCH